MNDHINLPKCNNCKASLRCVEAYRTSDQRWRKSCPGCGNVNYSERAPMGGSTLRPLLGRKEHERVS